jgi:magnesium chelatase subunit D
VSLAARHLKELPAGDRTPLPSGLREAGRLAADARPAPTVVVVVTDGRANVADGSPTRETREAARRLAETGASVVLVDAGDGDGLTDLLAAETDAERVSLADLSAERIDAAAGRGRD